MGTTLPLAVRSWLSARRSTSQHTVAVTSAMKAIIAVASSMLTAVFHMLISDSPYRELTASHFDRRDSTKQINRLVKRLEQLGMNVVLAPAA